MLIFIIFTIIFFLIKFHNKKEFNFQIFTIRKLKKNINYIIYIENIYIKY